MRDHAPVEINEINGLWRRGSEFSTPRDHQTDLVNFKFTDDGIKTRDGVGPYQNLANPLGNVLRSYTFMMSTGPTLLVLVEGGSIYHVTGPTTILGPILTIAAMTDFGFLPFNDRAYINPFYENASGQMVGIQNEKMYVYLGAGAVARKAGGVAPTNSSAKPFIAVNSEMNGVIDWGVHIISVAYRNAGVDGILGPEVPQVVIAPGAKQIQLLNIPIGPGGTTQRIITMTRSINPKDYVPGAAVTNYEVTRINDNTTTSLLISVADTGLTVVYVPGATAAPVTNALLAVNTSIAGYTDFGFHLIGVVYETNTGHITAPGPEYFAGITTVDVTKAITVSNIPVSPNTYVTKRHLLATKAIRNYNGDQVGYQLFYIPNGNIDDNVTTTKTVSFYDSDLFDDASHLLDNFAEIPAGTVIASYHDRLVSIAEYDNVSVARVSAVGEPEAISQVDGLIEVTKDGRELTNAQEFRDVLYLFKQTKTIAYNDNGDVPSTWKPVILDQGVGTHNFGIAKVLDSGGVNVDYLLIADTSGIFIFNGAYSRPELTYKVKDLWDEMPDDEFRYVMVINDSQGQKLYVILTDGTILFGDYTKGLTPKSIRWDIWTFDFLVRSACLINKDELVIGAYV